jgi:hypothetical protein
MSPERGEERHAVAYFDQEIPTAEVVGVLEWSERELAVLPPRSDDSIRVLRMGSAAEQTDFVARVDKPLGKMIYQDL